MIFGSRYAARFEAKGAVALRPNSLCALYDRRGRWLNSFSREGVRHRDQALALGWLLLQFPLSVLCGTLAILGFSAFCNRYLDIDPVFWRGLFPQTSAELLVGGFILGALGRTFFEFVRKRLIIWHAKPVSAPMGSAEREKLYRRIAKRGGTTLLAPLDITPSPSATEWPLPEKYKEWVSSLENRGFQHLGQFMVPETKSDDDFWFNQDNDLRATIVSSPVGEMWLSVGTRYEDGSSFSAANKDSTGLDQNPNRPVTYLGPGATADALVDFTLRNRPDGKRSTPTAERLLDDYKEGWRKGIEWRRARGTTAEEIKRVDERRVRSKAAGIRSS